MTNLISDTNIDLTASTTGKSSRRSIDATAILTFYLFLLMAIPAILVFKPVGAAGGPATLFALLVFVLYLGLWLRSGRYLDRGRQPARIIAVLFTCVILASYASANRHLLPVLEKNAADRGLMFTFGWLGITLLAADGIHSPDRLRKLLRRQVFGATAMGLLAAVQFVTGLNAANYITIPGLSPAAQFTDLLSRGAFNRPSSTASHPIELGAVLVMTLPLALHQALFAPAELRRRRWFQVGILALTAPMTVSRSAILGLIIGAIALLPTWPRRTRRAAYLAIGSVFAVGWMAVPKLVTTIGDLFIHISSDTSTQSRTKAISWAWSYVTQNPWLGRGFDTFQPQTYFYIDNQYITSLIETGIVGILALATVFIGGWLIARSARRMCTDRETRHLGQALAASIVVSAVSFSNYDALAFPVASGLTFLLLGCCGAYWRLAQRGQATLSGGRTRLVEK